MSIIERIKNSTAVEYLSEPHFPYLETKPQIEEGLGVKYDGETWVVTNSPPEVHGVRGLHSYEISKPIDWELMRKEDLEDESFFEDENLSSPEFKNTLALEYQIDVVGDLEEISEEVLV